jgi:HEAT repeat protein
MLACASLLRFACDGNDKVAHAAAQAIRSLLSAVTPLDLAFLDLYVRTSGSWSSTRGSGGQLSPDDVRRLLALQQGAGFTLGLASFNRDGFVREAATRALSESTTGVELPFLLVRANDWIEPVREVATQALRERAQAQYVPHLVRNLPLILRLREVGRCDHEPLVQALEEVVVGAAASGELRAAFADSDRHLRRAAIDVAVARHKVSLCLNALDSADAMVRLRSARFLFDERLPIEGCSLVDELAADGFSAVRREALRYAAEHCPQNLRERVTVAMCDRSPAVRRAGIHYARSKLGLDAVAFYRQALRSGRVDERRYDMTACIGGLGENGDVADVPMLREFVEHPLPRVRRAALQAIAALDFDSNEELFITALASPQPGVSRKARELLVKEPLRGEHPELERAMLDSAFAHVRNNALWVLAGSGKWSGLRYILLALQHDDFRLQDAATRALSRWVLDNNRRFTRPQSDDLVQIDSLLEALRNSLAEDQYAALRAIVASFDSD